MYHQLTTNLRGPNSGQLGCIAKNGEWKNRGEARREKAKERPWANVTKGTYANLAVKRSNLLYL